MKTRWREPGGESGSRLGYLELFAGSGRAILDGVEYDGCPLIAAEPGTFFHKLAFIECDDELATALQLRLRSLGFGPERALVIAGDANDKDMLAQAMDYLPEPGLVFAFIDPEDINGDWRAIEYLNSRRKCYPKHQRVDFLINLPIGPMKRNYSNDAKITRVLGTDDWKMRVDAGEPLGIVFRETFAQQFKHLGFQTAEHMEIRSEATNTPVYDLVFASRDPRGIDFWEKIQQINPSGQRALF
jgi:three-Cys-motif partner protein